MRIIIIGGVAAGTSAAAKARRNDEEAEICIYEMGEFISYSTCGMPYMIGREDVTAEDLTPRNPSWFRTRFNIDIYTGHEVLDIDPTLCEVKVKNLADGSVFTDVYDELVLATGSRASIPPITGAGSNHVFTLKTMEESLGLKAYITENRVKTAAVIGSGFIGMEIYENLVESGIDTVLIEAEKTLLPMFDNDMGIWIQDYMVKAGRPFFTGELVSEITCDSVITSNGRSIQSDLVVIAAGVKPETSLAKAAGVETGTGGGIIVDEHMNTSIPHISAAGDCILMSDLLTGGAIYRPMGSTANKTGRIAGDRLTGGHLEFRGVLGTGILKFFDLQIGISGLTQAAGEALGLDLEIAHNIKENQSKYLPESREMIIKAVADRKSGKLLGVQIIGEAGVDKRLDVFVTAMSFGAAAADLFHLDLSYAPPFSTTKDPVMYTGMILDNAINHGRKIILPQNLAGNEAEYQIIDVRSSSDYAKGHIPGAVNIPLAQLRGRLSGLDRNKPVVTHCNKGVTGNAGQNLLLNSGFTEVYNLSGGIKNYNIYRKYISGN